MIKTHRVQISYFWTTWSLLQSKALGLSLFLNIEEMTCLIFFVLTRYETVLLSRASRAASQGHLESGLVGQT